MREAKPRNRKLEIRLLTPKGTHILLSKGRLVVASSISISLEHRSATSESGSKASSSNRKSPFRQSMVTAGSPHREECPEIAQRSTANFESDGGLYKLGKLLERLDDSLETSARSV